MVTAHSSHLEAAEERKPRHESGGSSATQRRPSIPTAAVRSIPEEPEAIDISLSPDRQEAKVIAPALQVHADKLFATWLGQSHRSFSTVEDSNLVAYLKHISETFGGVKVKLPSQGNYEPSSWILRTKQPALVFNGTCMSVIYES